MPSVLAPFGLRPVSHMGGGQIRTEEFTITSAYATAIYYGSAIRFHTDGTLILGTNSGAIGGVFAGVEYVDSTGRPQTKRHWAASTAGTNIRAYAWIDQDIVYEIQADATLTQADVFEAGNLAATGANGYDDGNTLTGWSEASLSAAAVTSSIAQFQVLGAGRDPANLITDTYPIVRVRISQHQLYGATSAAI